MANSASFLQIFAEFSHILEDRFAFLRRVYYWYPFKIMRMKKSIARFVAWFCLLLMPAGASVFGDAQSHLRVLFLGDNDHHRPADRFKQLQPLLAKRDIEMDYTDSLADLNPAKLAGYDCLLVYANYTKIEPAQEKALLDFVAAGGGFVPVHCASYCFLNSPKYVELVGAQFQTHGTGVFKETIIQPDHPIMKGLQPIESWDETYVHTKHNPNKIVLSERRDDKGAEPYTWVREHGKGRVFYTAWGHDQRTWSNPNFQGLIENGIRWASENSPTRLKVRLGLKPFEYMEAPAPLPNYVPNASWGTQGDPIRTMQKPLEPTESMQHLALFPEFGVSLFASDPQIIKPIWMSWDERGRLWIAETIDYPNQMQKPGEGHDQIKICEDTDGDGRADKFTVFVDKLSVPTSFVFANGGIIVVHSGKTEFFKDTDGDDKADVREVLFTGWGTNDTHAGPSNLRYGFDNWIWGVVGYSGFQGTVGEKQIRFGQGIYRFKPDGSALEFIRSSNNNTWGLAFTEDNIVIGSTANGNASMYMPIPNRYYESVNGWSASRLETIADSQRFYPLTDKVRQVDYHGRYTAGAGSAIYTARNFPKEYWNSVQFVAEPTGHLLGKFHLEPRGADYIAHNGRSFLASDDEWTSPVCAEVGPDGALWVIDWYNYIIQHNPTPRGFQTGKGNAYDTPLRDKTHGRIYRIVYKEAQNAASPKLDHATPRELVAALKNNNMLWRMTAQRLLIARANKDVAPALCALVRDQSIDEIGLNPAAIHALWTLHGLGALDASNAEANDAAISALKHPSAAVRRGAVMVLPHTSTFEKAIAQSKLLEDSDAQVRLATLLALSEMPASEESARNIFAMLQNPKNSEDRWIADAATAAAARSDAAFLRQVLASYKPAASEHESSKPQNLLPNPSFENEQSGKPAAWRTVNYSGRAELTLANIGHSGQRSAKIVSEQGTDASWSAQVPVKPRTDYRLTAWIKTENVQKLGNARGALLNIHELQDPEHGATKPLLGDNDWTQVQLTFNSGEQTQLTVNCLFGGWGRARGAAYFDDVELTEAPGAALPGEVGRIVRVVTTHYAQRGPTDSIIPTLAALKGASSNVAVPVLDGLVSGWPQGEVPSIGEREKSILTQLMQSMPESIRDRLLALAQKWNRIDIFGQDIAAIIQSLQKQTSDPSASDESRIAAAKRLVALNDSPEIIDSILKQVNTLTPPNLANGLINALTESRNRDTGRAVLATWPQFTPNTKRAAVAALMRRPDWTLAMLDAIEKNKISRTDLAAEHWSQLKQSPNKMIAFRADKLSGTVSAISADREQIVKKLLPLAKEKGDPTRGKEVFTATCAVCHTFDGQGGKVGPDLTGVGARDRSEILIDILDPNRSVEANFRLWNITTKTGETYSGRLETETQTSIELLDIAGQKHAIQRKDIATMEGTQLSIMPSGFEALPPDDLKSLLEFLTRPHA
jgi:putative membrane-bound dehydrogenase-like protein